MPKSHSLVTVTLPKQNQCENRQACKNQSKEFTQGTVTPVNCNPIKWALDTILNIWIQDTGIPPINQIHLDHQYTINEVRKQNQWIKWAARPKEQMWVSK